MLKLDVNKEQAQEIVAKVEEIRGKISVDKSNSQNTIEDSRSIQEVFANKKSTPTPPPFPTKDEEIRAIQNALANNKEEFILNEYKYTINSRGVVCLYLSPWNWEIKYIIGYADTIYEYPHDNFYFVETYMDRCFERFANAEEYFNQFSQEDILAAEKCLIDYGWDDMEHEYGVDPYVIFFDAICYAKNYTIKLESKRKEE